MDYLTEMCDYMENQNRRNNLVFTGFASVVVGGGGGGSELSEDCERKVKSCVKEGMGIAVLEMERTHRVEKAIVIRFLPHKLMLVLTSARKLKSSNGYDNVYVREGFWETVQEKR